MRETVFTNARVVTEQDVFRGTVVVRQGRIAGVERSVAASGLDLDGDYLLPGLVDVHTDSLEKQFLPRHGVYWPSPLSAAMANDALMSGCGITTVLDSICAEAFPEEETRRRMFNDCIEAVACGVRGGLFRSRHRLHLRCETADPKTPAILGRHLDNPLVVLASLMDHTPGQRQYRDVEKFREYYTDEGWSDQEFGRVVRRLQAEARQYADPQRTDIVNQCRARSIPLASHDDATPEHVARAAEEGVTICEFPTTGEAAEAARAAGMDVVMGAPNVVLGGSHSGNVAALEVFRQGNLTVLASDYVPSSLVTAPFILHRLGAPLHESLALVSANPARMLGLDDRGSIGEGKLADLVRVRTVDGQPVVLQTWMGARERRAG
jgi:alpha-D-ribose 1-methylphosphonate 5-triphosphate diphosphatase